ncbi:MAG: spore coat protein CotJB [Clostridia bacterium]|nr:spore coat protein CotJB [Clostridia bacterium]
MTQRNQRAEALYKVQKSGFALYDTALFLDTHPHDAEALEAFCEYKKIYDADTAYYEEHYGPLSFPAAENGECWEWYKGPWPWEAEA